MLDSTNRKKQQGARTRAALIDAAILCLAREGYHRTNPVRIAQMSGVSRGAVLHHFADRQEMISSTIVELHERRLRALSRLDLRGRSSAGEIMRVLWKQISTDAATAMQELKYAAQTDVELAAILHPIERDFEGVWEQKAANVFEDWQENIQTYKVARTLALTVLEGLSFRRRTDQIDNSVLEATLDQLEKVMFDLYPSLEGQ